MKYLNTKNYSLLLARQCNIINANLSGIGKQVQVN